MPQPWILVVEDNPDEARLVCEAFAEMAPGIGVVVATCATDAFARLSGLGPHDLPRLLITDRHLPDIKGEDLIARIRTQPQAQGLAMVMLSGGMSPPPGLGSAEWHEKPVTWSAWCAWADKLAVRHLRADH